VTWRVLNCAQHPPSLHDHDRRTEATIHRITTRLRCRVLTHGYPGTSEMLPWFGARRPTPWRRGNIPFHVIGRPSGVGFRGAARGRPRERRSTSGCLMEAGIPAIRRLRQRVGGGINPAPGRDFPIADRHRHSGPPRGPREPRTPGSARYGRGMDGSPPRAAYQHIPSTKPSRSLRHDGSPAASLAGSWKVRRGVLQGDVERGSQTV